MKLNKNRPLFVKNNFKNAFEEFWHSNRDRFILWMPVAFGLGIVAYFQCKQEPMWSYAVCPVIAMVILLLLSWRSVFRAFLWFPLFMALGFFCAKNRTDMLNTPMLNEKREKILLTGTVLSLTEHLNKSKTQKYSQKRLVLHLSDGALNDIKIHKVRLTYYPNQVPKGQVLSIGDTIQIKSDLLPLSPPSSLHGVDYRQQAYFQGISAVGRIQGPILIQTTAPFTKIDGIRHSMTNQLRTHLPGATGGIAAALITGDRVGIPDDTRQAFADAGLAHILAISGLHLSLIAGILFFVLTRLFLFIPPRYLPKALWDTRKIAAIFVMLTTAFYLLLSGAGLPAIRAFVMISLAMTAILLNRHPLSMRLVAIAAMAILVLWPESLLSVSFQLSFAAVIALIAAYESGWAPLRDWAMEGGKSRKVVTYSLGLILTTSIATLATTPLTIYAFNRFTLQALVANLLAIPLTAFLIMPTALCLAISLLLNQDPQWLFALFGKEIQGLIHIATIVSTWPGAAILVSTPPTLFLWGISLGALWLCLWRGPWRLLGLGGIAFGLCSLFFRSFPEVYLAGDGAVIGVYQGNALYVSCSQKISQNGYQRGQFYIDMWLKELGLKEATSWKGPVFWLGQTTAVVSTYRIDLKPICSTASQVISSQYIAHRCRLFQKPQEALSIIDRQDLKEQGTLVGFREKEHLIFRPIDCVQSKRPWSFHFEF